MGIILYLYRSNANADREISSITHSLSRSSISSTGRKFIPSRLPNHKYAMEDTRNEGGTNNAEKDHRPRYRIALFGHLPDALHDVGVDTNT